MRYDLFADFKVFGTKIAMVMVNRAISKDSVAKQVEGCQTRSVKRKGHTAIVVLAAGYSKPWRVSSTIAEGMNEWVLKVFEEADAVQLRNQSRIPKR